MRPLRAPEGERALTDTVRRSSIDRRFIAAVLTSFGLLACSDATGPNIEQQVASIEIEPTQLTLKDGESARFTATLKDGNGRTIPTPSGRGTTWSSTPREILGIDAEGFATALRPGAGRVKVEFGSKNAWATILVTPVPSELFALNGTAHAGAAGAQLKEPVRLRVVDRHGNAVPGTRVDFAISEGAGSLSAQTASADESGEAQVHWTLGARAGENQLRASVSGLPPLDLTAVGVADESSALGELIAGNGQTASVGEQLAEPLELKASDALGNTLIGAPLEWFLSGGEIDPAIEGGSDGSVTDSDGVSRVCWTLGPDAGPHSASVRLAGRTIATFEASALAGPAAQLVVTPRISVLGVGQTQQLAAELQDRFGNGVPVDALSWSSGDADVAQVSQLGLITGIAPGSIDVSVVASAAAPVGSSQTPATVSGSAQVTITGGGATDFVVDTGDGQTGHAGSPFPAPLVAKVVDSDGFGVADIAVAWAVTAGGGSVDQLLTSTDGNGLSTVTWTSGPGVGTQTLTATAEGLGSVVFTGDVLPGLAAVVTVEAENTALVWGQYTTLSVSAVDPFGGPVSVTDVEWGTSDASVLSVAGGLVRGIAAGVAQATATVDGQTGSATISVTPYTSALQSLAILPDLATMNAGASLTFSVVGIDIGGATLSNLPVRYQAAGGTIDPFGVYTAGTVSGTYPIVAAEASSGLADTAWVTVAGSSSPPPPSSGISYILVTPQNAVLGPGASRQFDAVGVMADGSSVPIAATFSATGGSVSQTGLYTAGSSPGQYTVVATDPTGLSGSTTVWITGSGGSSLTPPSNVTLSLGATYPDQTIDIHASWPAVTGITDYGFRFEAGDNLSPPQSAQTSTLARTLNVRQRSISAYDATVCLWSMKGSSRSAETCRTILVPQWLPGSGGEGGGGGGGGAPTLVGVGISPSAMTVAPGGGGTYTAWGIMSDGSTSSLVVTWSATGGTISSAGLYTAPGAGGAFQVTATAPSGGLTATAIVTVTGEGGGGGGGGTPTLVGVGISPSTVTVAPGGGGTYTAWGIMSDGSTSSLAVTWSTTGGSITSAGLYTAPATGGNYQVTATAPSGGLTATATVTVTGGGGTPTLVGVGISPAGVTLSPSGQRQFTAWGIMSDGSTSTLAVTWSATGGTINPAGPVHGANHRRQLPGTRHRPVRKPRRHGDCDGHFGGSPAADPRAKSSCHPRQ